MDAAGQTLSTKVFGSMSVDWYNAYMAYPSTNNVQPGIMVEPAV